MDLSNTLTDNIWTNVNLKHNKRENFNFMLNQQYKWDYYKEIIERLT
jgi:hypothetical protein